MNTTSEKWRQYGVMVKNTRETVGGMLRIEANDGKQIIGEPVAFCYTQEQADRVVNAVNCHADLLQACKCAVSKLSTLDPYPLTLVQMLDKAIHKAETL